MLWGRVGKERKYSIIVEHLCYPLVEVQLNVCGMDKVLCGLAGVAESCSVWEWITTDEKLILDL